MCELLGLNDFLLPPLVNSALSDKANEIENFHPSQIDFEPETACGGEKNPRKWESKCIVLVEHDNHFREGTEIN